MLQSQRSNISQPSQTQKSSSTAPNNNGSGVSKQPSRDEIMKIKTGGALMRDSLIKLLDEAKQSLIDRYRKWCTTDPSTLEEARSLLFNDWALDTIPSLIPFINTKIVTIEELPQEETYSEKLKSEFTSALNQHMTEYGNLVDQINDKTQEELDYYRTAVESEKLEQVWGEVKHDDKSTTNGKKQQKKSTEVKIEALHSMRTQLQTFYESKAEKKLKEVKAKQDLQRHCQVEFFEKIQKVMKSSLHLQTIGYRVFSMDKLLLQENPTDRFNIQRDYMFPSANQRSKISGNHQDLQLSAIYHNQNKKSWQFELSNGMSTDFDINYSMERTDVPQMKGTNKYTLKVYYSTQREGVSQEIQILQGLEMYEGNNLVMDVGTGIGERYEFTVAATERIVGLVAKQVDPVSRPGMLSDVQFLIAQEQ